MKKLLLMSVLTSFGILFAKPIWAISIGFEPFNQVVQVGDPVTVDLVVSGLTAAGEIVSSFDLDVTYDHSILSATAVAFGLELGDYSIAEALIASDITIPGLVDLWELSLLDDSALALLQDDDVFLATLSFVAMSPGTSSLGFIFDDFNLLTGYRANVLSIDASTGTVTAVPAASTLLLLCTGLAAMAVRRSTR